MLPSRSLVETWESQVENVIRGEELSTETTPHCGGYRCGKCPTVGHSYSFREEQELKTIQENLEYDHDNRCWITSYPRLVDPSTLPDNYGAALATLKNTERTARTIGGLRHIRNRRRNWSIVVLQKWSGPKFYISHLAVVNARSHSMPVRIVFNSSQVCQGTFLNSCLAKGPECFMNNLIGILLR